MPHSLPPLRPPSGQPPAAPESEGQAALLLVESLIHALLDNGGLTRAQAIAALDSACDVEAEREPSRARRPSLRLLRDMRRSIEAHPWPHGDRAGAESTAP